MNPMNATGARRTQSTGLATRPMQSSQGAQLRGQGRQGNIIPEGYDYGQIQQFTPEQMQLFSQMYGSHLGPESYLSKLALGDQGEYSKMEDPAYRQFHSLIGDLANRFSNQGDIGGRSGTEFQNATTSAAGNFAQDLQSQRSNIRRQAIQDLLSYSNQFLNQRPYDQFLTEKPQPFSQRLTQDIVRGLTSGGGAGGGGGNLIDSVWDIGKKIFSFF